MAVKKTTTKVEAEVKESKEEKESPEGEYFYAVGKRKTSIAQVRLYPSSKAKGVVINGKKLENYFPVERLQNLVKAPVAAVGQEGKADVVAKVVGGGITGQAGAGRLGIARALVKYDSTYKKVLRDLGYMTRDARVVERKKPGLKKARKSPQWAKR
jgi:small subunit ribosomal protein S9